MTALGGNARSVCALALGFALGMALHPEPLINSEPMEL